MGNSDASKRLEHQPFYFSTFHPFPAKLYHLKTTHAFLLIYMAFWLPSIYQYFKDPIKKSYSDNMESHWKLFGSTLIHCTYNMYHEYIYTIYTYNTYNAHIFHMMRLSYKEFTIQWYTKRLS